MARCRQRHLIGSWRSQLRCTGKCINKFDPIHRGSVTCVIQFKMHRQVHQPSYMTWVMRWCAMQCIKMHTVHCTGMILSQGNVLTYTCVTCVNRCKIHRQLHVFDAMPCNVLHRLFDQFTCVWSYDAQYNLCGAMHKDALVNASSYALRYTGNCIIPNICVMQCIEEKATSIHMWLMQWCATYCVWCNAHVNTANAHIQQIHHIY